MGKFKTKRSDLAKPSRNVPVTEQLFEEKYVRPPGREKRRRRREEDDDVCNYCTRWSVHLVEEFNRNVQSNLWTGRVATPGGRSILTTV